MRALSYVIALVFVLTGPSLAGGRDVHLLRVTDCDTGARRDGRNRPVTPAASTMGRGFSPGLIDLFRH
jgi:hypothetical protein